MAMKIIGIKSQIIMMKISKFSICIFILSLIVSCNELNNLDFHEDGVYKLHLNIKRDTYDMPTRSSESSWQDGDCLFLFCNNGLNKCSGVAKYKRADDLWEIKFNGDIPSGNLTCELYFLEDFQKNDDVLLLTSKSCVYSDYNAHLTVAENDLYLSASLSLPLARLRIKGQQNIQSKIIGLKVPEYFNIKSGEIAFSKSPLEVKIQEDGFTEYIYTLIENPENAITAVENGIAYKRIFPENLITAGKSGYFDLPTSDNHSGWEKYTVSAPIISKVNVSEVCYRKVNVDASIINNGNGTILDYGYCYSLYSNPTINSASLSLINKDENSFLGELDGLQPNTTYHIRAYAINEFGIGYGEETEVSTKNAVLPSLSSVTVSNIESKTITLETDIEDKGDDYLTSSGYVYSKTNNQPTLSDNFFDCDVSDKISATITDLEYATTYYIRAYATNPQGTSYSEVINVTTKKDPTVWDGKSVATSFDGGIGSKEDPIRIATAAQLKLLADNVNNKKSNYTGVHFKLTADIDLNNYPWVPIGRESSSFGGTFDGAGHIVKGINTKPYFDTYYQYAGFFGHGYNMIIRNLAVCGFISGNQQVNSNVIGGIIGDAYGKIENCINLCNMNMGGGITARIWEQVNINNCVNYGNGASGGIIGEGIPYYPGKCYNSFWIYDVSNGLGNEYATPSATPDRAFTNCAPFTSTNSKCLIAPNYTKDLVDELNNWVNMNDGEVHYNKWAYEIVNGKARPTLIPED